MVLGFFFCSMLYNIWITLLAKQKTLSQYKRDRAFAGIILHAVALLMRLAKLVKN